MTGLYQIIVLRVGVVLLAALAVVSAFVWLVHACRCVGRQLKTLTLVVMSFVAIAATVLAQKSDRSTGATGVPPVEVTQASGIQPVGNEVTNTLHFAAIDVHTNGMATLTVAWPSGLILSNTTIDILAATSLVNSVWVWQCQHTVAEGETTFLVSVAMPEIAPGTNAPSAFFRAVHRETCADTMDDLDGDGIPGAYEIRRGGNPYVADYGSVEKMTVGPDGDFQSIEDAVAESEPYDIIVLDALAIHEIGGRGMGLGCELPSYPIMLAAPAPYAVVRSTRWSAFMFPSGSTSRTLIRNLYVLLDRPRDFQAGFWCGGNLPWDGIPAAATFENVYVRMPNPDVRYRAWNFYRSCADTASIRDCTVNAAGATWAVGIYLCGSPTLEVDRCSLVNFPQMQVSPSGNSLGEGVGVILVSQDNGDGGSSVSISRTVFDESFTNAIPLYRSEQTRPYILAVTNCIIPSALTNWFPDSFADLAVTNAALAWSGIPRLESPSVPLGIGALAMIDNNPSVDFDNDGFSDYEEAYGRGTDPFNADSDNDGVDDYTEIAIDDTDPTNQHSFKQRLTVSVTNTASFAHAVYTAWGYSSTGWESNGLETFSQGFGDTVYTNASSQGAIYIKAFCDLNDNGEYDAAYDILLMREIPLGAMAQVNFVFGDVDGDGVIDAQERQEHTDPYDANNFRFIATVNIESSDVVQGLTNFVAWGYLPTGWETNDLVSFTGNSLAFPVDGVTVNGELYVKVFRDFNTNGVYDAGVDALVSNKLARTDNGKTVTFRIGDSDNDGIPDSVELGEGTNPSDRSNYCFTLSQTYTGIFQTTNALTFSASFGTNRVYGPCVVADRVWTHDFGHCVAMSGEKASVSVWDDANHNGECDAGETSNRYVIAITSHDMVVTNALTYINFDRDGNTLPDWWEVQEGLGTEGVPRRA